MHNYSYFNYSYIYIFFIFSFILTCFLLILNLRVSPKIKVKDKNTSYECGYIPFDDTRSIFDINFFLIGILFIIFDLELAFLFPWAVCLLKLNCFGFISVVIFILVLFFGFFLEWGLGAFDFKGIIYSAKYKDKY